MMKQIMENLSRVLVLPEAALRDLERHLAENYPHLSPADHDKVVQQYLENQLEVHLNNFDDQFRAQIQQQLYHNIVTKNPNEVSGLDILEACLQLNFDMDSFNNELKQWILSYPDNRGLHVEAVGLIELLRQMGKSYPEMTLLELFDAEKLFVDAATQVVNENTLNSVWGENNSGNVVPVDQVYFDNNQWVDEPKDQENWWFHRWVTIVTLGIASFGLILVSFLSLLIVSGHKPDQKGRQVKITQTVPARQTRSIKLTEAAKPTHSSVIVVPEVKQAEKPNPSIKMIPDDPIRDNRLKRVSITNRARQWNRPVSAVKKKSLLKRTIPVAVKAPLSTSGKISERNEETTGTGISSTVKASGGTASPTVVVGYTEANNGITTTKVPLVKTFSSKLKLKANSSGATLNRETEAADNTEETGAAPSGTAVAKGKAVTVDPKVIPPGSRVYIKYPPEYRNLDGIYTTEAVETKKTGNQGKIVLGQTGNVAGVSTKGSTGVDGQDVEVYVLDGKE